MACDVPVGVQKNFIKSMVFGFVDGGDLQHPHTSISGLINLQIYSTTYNSLQNRQAFLARMKSENVIPSVNFK